MTDYWPECCGYHVCLHNGLQRVKRDGAQHLHTHTFAPDNDVQSLSVTARLWSNILQYFVSDEYQTLHMNQKTTLDKSDENWHSSLMCFSFKITLNTYSINYMTRWGVCWPASDPSEREPIRGAAWRRPPRRKCCVKTWDLCRHTCHMTQHMCVLLDGWTQTSERV